MIMFEKINYYFEYKDLYGKIGYIQIEALNKMEAVRIFDIHFYGCSVLRIETTEELSSRLMNELFTNQNILKYYEKILSE